MWQLVLRIVAALCFVLPLCAADYKVTVLPIDQANAINNAGEVVGIKGGRAVLWTREGGVQDLGTLGGLSSYAAAINASGLIAGQADLSGGFPVHAFRWTPNTGMQDLGSLGTDSIALDINSVGDVVGSYSLPNDPFQHAFLWTEKDGMQDLGSPLGGDTIAVGVTSDRHVILQSSDPSRMTQHAYLWDRSNGAVDMGGIGGHRIVPSKWNDLGQTVGQAFLSDDVTLHAFLWTPGGSMQDLGTLPGGENSAAWDINASGSVVGYSTDACCIRGFYWTPQTGMQRIGGNAAMTVGINDNGLAMGNDLGFFVWSPSVGLTHIPKFDMAFVGNINNAGQIVGARFAQPNNIPELATPIIHVALTSSQNPSRAGQSVAFTVAASSLAGSPPDGESVQFKDGKKLLATVPLSAGQASFSTSALAVGKHSITATYSGDANYNPAKSKLLKQVVNP